MKRPKPIVRRSAGLIVGVACALLAGGCATNKVRCTGKLEPINRVAPQAVGSVEKEP